MWLGGMASLFALASCWYDIPDPAVEAVASASSTVTSSATGQGGGSGSGSGSRGGGGGAGGTGGGGQSGGGNVGGGEPTPVGGAFTACQDNGYSGYCVGIELLVYDNSSTACMNEPTDACILNRCSTEGETCDLDTKSACEEHKCSDGYDLNNFEICGTKDILAEGECIDGVAIVPTTETRCVFKDCGKVGGTCQTPPAVLTTDCY
jgi:hypothetical protein